jgi:hypothetical protein
MKKSEKEKITNAINAHIAEYGWSFEYSKMSGIVEGRAILAENKIIMRQSCDYETLAHEMAHLKQYALNGATQCNSTPLKQRNYKLIFEHNAITDAFKAELVSAGVAQMIDKALDMSRVKY